MMKLTVATLTLCLLFLATACSGPGRSVAVKWEAETSQASLAEESSPDGASPLKTVVYVSISGDVTIRDAVVRLSEENAEHAVGLSIGTTTQVSTEFQGTSRFWRLGDLEPGKRYGLAIGLFFSSTHTEAAPETLVLAVEVLSPDLAEPVRSNDLALRLTR